MTRFVFLGAARGARRPLPGGWLGSFFDCRAKGDAFPTYLASTGCIMLLYCSIPASERNR
jgi:hypothetical protein